MLPLGTISPDFALEDTRKSYNKIQLSEYAKDKPILITFICNHCPFVHHIIEQFVEIINQYQDRIKTIAISSNDIDNYPEDAPDKMTELAKQHHFQFPYCFDQDQSVAKAYQAACTPDFFLFDDEHKLFYRGRFDTSTPQNQLPVTGESLKEAIDNLLNHKPAPANQTPSIGCNIKWLDTGDNT